MLEEGSKRSADLLGAPKQPLPQEEVQRIQAKDDGEEPDERSIAQDDLQKDPKRDQLLRNMRGDQSHAPQEQLFHCFQREEPSKEQQNEGEDQSIEEGNKETVDHVQHLQSETPEPLEEEHKGSPHQMNTHNPQFMIYSLNAKYYPSLFSHSTKNTYFC